MRIVKQPPYSPDDNLYDRYLFSRLEAVRKNNFENRQDLVSFLNEQMPLFTSERTRRALTNLIEDIDTVIEKDGDYLF